MQLNVMYMFVFSDYTLLQETTRRFYFYFFCLVVYKSVLMATNLKDLL